ncbi:CLUMA_CG012229, isoform A [Clunio marinus]|uniref:CLUMA_CG012229, isoform A n=1 Tax=Clunio marinus TaxID=568069 RepID=A0A1J1IFJ8_9DIPT|nr:CLUMA_CG012229, isoform A [Clunio marinus]
MLYSKFLEGSSIIDASNSIKITDISYDTFETFLCYIYTGELKLNDNGNEINQLMELSYCAQKYLIEDMRKQCLKLLNKFLNNDTILIIIEKSFELHLEDFLVTCVYYFADSLETNSSFSNLVLNKPKTQLSPSCFEFLVKNLIDYLGERDNILCLIKAWAFVQVQNDKVLINDESQASKLRQLNLDNALTEKVVELKATYASDSSSTNNLAMLKSFHRSYYKPVSPLIIERNQMHFNTFVSFKRFSVINSLMVNSRLIPEQLDICDMSNQTYTEIINVEILEKVTGKSIYNQQSTIENVNFNAFFIINLKESLILFPHYIYIVKLSWNTEAIGHEYPRCIFSLIEKGDDDDIDTNTNKHNLSNIQFHEHDYYWPLGSIIQGITYNLVT